MRLLIFVESMLARVFGWGDEAELRRAYLRIEELERRCIRQAAIIRQRAQTPPPHPHDRLHVPAGGMIITIYTS